MSGTSVPIARVAAAPPAVSRHALNVVVICHLGRSGYNVQRALAAIGARCYVITDQRSASIRWSRSSRSLVHVAGDLGLQNADLIVDRINALHERVGISSVIPTDVTASMLVAAIRDRLSPPTFPIPSAAVMNTLDDKWEFAKICQKVGVNIPKTLYFQHNATIDRAQAEATLGYPMIVKPARGFGQRGIVRLDGPDDLLAFIGRDSHTRGIIQEYIPGQDWSLSVMAIDGIVTHWTAWECPSQLDSGYGVSRFLVTHFSGHDRLIEMVEAVIQEAGYSGIANFDARLGDDGVMRLFECNPRVFNRLLAARICGLNFIAAGLPGQLGTQQPALIEGSYYPWREALTLRGLKLLLNREWNWRYLVRDLSEMLCDPVPPLVRKFTREDEKAS